MPSGKNVAIVVLDTARADVVEPTPNSSITPEIGRIASEGTTFTNAFSSAPWTLPSHASLFTGAYPSKHGAHAEHKQLEGSRTITESLADAGYETVAASNNTWVSESFGFGGFDTFFKGWQYVQSQDDLAKIGLTHHGIDLWKAVVGEILRGKPITTAVNALYAGYGFRKRQIDDGAKRTNRFVSRWLDDRGDESFFLFVNYLEPHLEYRPPREHAQRFLPAGTTYEEAMDVPQEPWKYITNQIELSDDQFDVLRALYRAEIAYVDERIGELRRALEAAGEWEDTVFIVLGDHGENIGDHGFMDHQYCLYDTLLHVPLIATGGSFAGGGEVDELVQLTDIVPTLLEELKVRDPELHDQSQGRSIHHLQDDPREHVIAEYLGPQPARDAIEARVGDPDDVMDKYDRSLRCIRTERTKLVVGSDGTRDLYEAGNESDVVEDSERADELATRLDRWLNSFRHADPSGSASMDEETKEVLEDLGYLQ